MLWENKHKKDLQMMRETPGKTSETESELENKASLSDLRGFEQCM